MSINREQHIRKSGDRSYCGLTMAPSMFAVDVMADTTCIDCIMSHTAREKVNVLKSQGKYDDMMEEMCNL